MSRKLIAFATLMAMMSGGKYSRDYSISVKSSQYAYYLSMTKKQRANARRNGKRCIKK